MIRAAGRFGRYALDRDAEEPDVISGHDTVLVAAGPVADALRRLLDDLYREWPQMLVAAEELQAGAFLPWVAARGTLPATQGELLVARDEAMLRRWENDGYSLMERGEGPFMLAYQPAGRTATEIHFQEDPYGRPAGFLFEPYPATLIASGFSLVTVVTPDAESLFSRGLVTRLQQALTH
jgi:hypothetical protein